MAVFATKHSLSFQFTFLLLAIALVICQQWSIVSKHEAKILMGVSCVNATTCWISGDNNDGNAIQITSNAGNTWSEQQIGDVSLFLFCTEISKLTDTTFNGFSSGLGIFKLQGSAYSPNATVWEMSDTHHIFGAFQDCGAVSSSEKYQIGQWSSIGVNGDGVMWSSDGGKDFTGFNWNQTTTSRYGSFVNRQVGFISGGQWPEPQNDLVMKHVARKASRHVSLNNPHIFSQNLVMLENEAIHIPSHLTRNTVNDTTLYVGTIAKTTDGGKTWQTVYHTQGIWSYYFNGIDCTDVNNCWAVAEGQNSTTGAVAAYIFHTSNGGSSWTQQLYVEDGSLTMVKMLNAQQGWAVGADKTGAVLQGQFWNTQNGGRTWTLGGDLPNFYPLNLSVIDATHAFAVGPQGQFASSVAKFA